jgi:8-amino-3,8-dideoxy-alpha-D-manno-octulosonate transaminase
MGSLKNSSSLSPLNDPQQEALKKLQSQDLSESDAIMSHCISSAISLLWTPDQIGEACAAGTQIKFSIS